MLRADLGLADGAEAAGRLRLQKDLVLALPLLLLRRLLLQLVRPLVLDLDLALCHGRLLALRPPLVLNEDLLEVLLELLAVLLLHKLVLRKLRSLLGGFAVRGGGRTLPLRLHHLNQVVLRQSLLILLL